MAQEAAATDHKGSPKRGRLLGEFFRLRLHPWGLLTAAGAWAFVGTLIGFLGCLWWPLDLFSHFRCQYLATLLLIAAILALGRQGRRALLVGGFAIPNLLVILPFYLGGTAPSGSGDSPSLRAMLLNVNTRSGDPARVARTIQDADPDFLLLEEISEEWLGKLEDLHQSHPHSVVQTRSDNFGIGLFSKLPLEGGRIVYLGDAFVPSVIGKVEVQGKWLHIFGTHPPPPGGRQSTGWRDQQLASIPEYLRAYPEPLLLLGDLNVSPWSCHFKRLLAGTGLSDSARGRGVQPTWPAGLPFLWIPIDHCLYSKGIEIRERRVGPNVGSDHYPVIVDFTLREG